MNPLKPFGMDDQEIKLLRSLGREIRSQFGGKVSVRPEGFYYPPFCPVRVHFPGKENLYLSTSEFILTLDTLEFQSPFLLSIKSPCRRLGLLKEITLKRENEVIHAYFSGLDGEQTNVENVFESGELWKNLSNFNSDNIREFILGWKQLSLTMTYTELNEIINCINKCREIRDFSKI